MACASVGCKRKKKTNYNSARKSSEYANENAAASSQQLKQKQKQDAGRRTNEVKLSSVNCSWRKWKQDVCGG